MDKLKSEFDIVGKKLPEWFVRECNNCNEGYYVTRSIAKVATSEDLKCNKCKQASSEEDADNKIAGLKLKLDRLTEENRKLREALKLITDQSEKYTAKTKGKGVKVREIREYDLPSAKQVLEGL